MITDRRPVAVAQAALSDAERRVRMTRIDMHNVELEANVALARYNREKLRWEIAELQRKLNAKTATLERIRVDNPGGK